MFVIVFITLFVVWKWQHFRSFVVCVFVYIKQLGTTCVSGACVCTQHNSRVSLDCGVESLNLKVKFSLDVLRLKCFVPPLNARVHWILSHCPVCYHRVGTLQGCTGPYLYARHSARMYWTLSIRQALCKDVLDVISTPGTLQGCTGRYLHARHSARMYWTLSPRQALCKDVLDVMSMPGTLHWNFFL